MTGMISVNRNELANALAFAQLGLSKRPVLPVLGGMRVSISCGTLELAATDCEVTARAKVSGEASGPGSALVSGSELAAVVKSLPKGRKVTADLLVSDDGMVVSCDGAESVIASLGAEAEGEYPAFPAMPELSGYVDGALFAASVARVAVCAGTDDTLPVLLCVQVTSDNGELVLAATDRYRLGVDRLHWTGPDGFAVDSLIPAVTLGRFAAMRDGQVAGTQVVPAVLEGPPLETGFHAPYLASVLSGIEGEAWIGLVNAGKPAQVTADGFTAVVMPIRKAEQS
jgi:DNA polymerase-3 subunit beta